MKCALSSCLCQNPKQFAKFSVAGRGTCVWLCRDRVQWLYATNCLELLGETSYRFQEDICLWNDDKDDVYTEIIQNDFEQNKMVDSMFNVFVPEFTIAEAERLEFQWYGLPSFWRICGMTGMICGKPSKIVLLHQWKRNEFEKDIFTSSLPKS